MIINRLQRITKDRQKRRYHQFFPDILLESVFYLSSILLPCHPFAIRSRCALFSKVFCEKLSIALNEIREEVRQEVGCSDYI